MSDGYVVAMFSFQSGLVSLRFSVQGDAPVHSIAAALFLPTERVHFFEKVGYYRRFFGPSHIFDRPSHGFPFLLQTFPSSIAPPQPKVRRWLQYVALSLTSRMRHRTRLFL